MLSPNATNSTLPASSAGHSSSVATEKNHILCNKKSDMVLIIMAVAVAAIGFVMIRGTLPGGTIAGGVVIGAGSLLFLGASADFIRRCCSNTKRDLQGPRADAINSRPRSSDQTPTSNVGADSADRTIDHNVNSNLPQQQLQRIAGTAQTDGVIAFHHENRNKDTAFLGNFFECPNGVTYRGIHYRNAEAAYQAKKFLYLPREEAIRLSLTPRNFSQYTAQEAWQIADNHKNKTDPRWTEINTGFMWEIIQAKFDQNSELMVALMATNDAYLLEHTPRDSYWGDGPKPDGSIGENKLGQMLMRLRAIRRGDNLNNPRFGTPPGALSHDFIPNRWNEIAERQCPYHQPATALRLQRHSRAPLPAPYHSIAAQQLQRIGGAARTDGVIAFHHENRNKDTAFLGNFFECPNGVRYNGNYYRSAEAAYQAQKFSHLSQGEAARLRLTPQDFSQYTAQQAWQIADDNKDKVYASWTRNNNTIMWGIVQAKFDQNPGLMEALMTTESAYLLEHTPRDSYWGDGPKPDGSIGENQLGQLLMELRATRRGDDLNNPRFGTPPGGLSQDLIPSRWKEIAERQCPYRQPAAPLHL